MSSVLSGKVAVITGGNQGIGLATARAMAGAGASLALAARTQASLESAAREIRSLGVDCLAVACDVANPESTDAMAATVLKHFGRVDVVVANAGIAGAIKPMHEITYEEWRDCLTTDLDGVYLTFRRFIPAMVEAGQGGSLIALSSMTGKRPLPDRTPYCAAKMGVIGLVRSLAMELGPHQIRVNSICPGAVAGDRLNRIVRQNAESRGITEAESMRQFSDPAALKRPTLAEEVAAACVFLAGEASSGITGEDMNVSAGLVMY
ncbi:MAG TPA: SDR family NAD(P)-dependent oxidoreductase [Candidatus Dormibacteraeota bacterium]|nr:SDR family NAD(P)-dependent oxidoreductase [Candidatus Dormibacteraeota bacterium]